MAPARLAQTSSLRARAAAPAHRPARGTDQHQHAGVATGARSRQRAPKRHQSGHHAESELRYLRPEGFIVPDQLAGLRRELSQPNPHTDRYYDAPSGGVPVLRAAGRSLRVRVKPSGQVLATYKIKLPDWGPAAERDETEDAVRCPRCEHLAQHCSCGLCGSEDDYVGMVNMACSQALTSARTASACRPFVFLYRVRNDRVDHHYRDGEAHVVLSEDHILYPDGSREQRIEVEHVAGGPERLERIDRELRKAYRGLVRCERGKASEARRRLAALLTA